MNLEMMESYCNRVMKKEIDTLFGEGSNIVFKKAFPISQTKSQQLVVEIKMTDPTSLAYWPENANLLVENAYYFVNGKSDDVKIIIQSSYELI